MSETTKLTHEQALTIVKQVAAYKDLRLCLDEHVALQNAITTLAAAVEELKQHLTSCPKDRTVS